MIEVRRTRTHIRHLGLIGLLAVSLAAVSEAQEVRQPHITAELVNSRQAIVPGERFLVALRLEADPGWHTYWKNPGDAGSSLHITWTLPGGFEAGELLYSAPGFISLPPLATYGYKGEVLFLTWISAPDNLAPGLTIPIQAFADWVVCEMSECIAGEAELGTRVHVVSDQSVANREWDARLQRVHAQLPRPAPDWTFVAAPTATGYRVRLTPPPGWSFPLDSLRFYVATGSVLEHAAPQPLQQDGRDWILSLKTSPYADGVAERLEGLLVSSAGWAGVDDLAAIEVSIPVAAAAAASTLGSGGLGSLLAALGLALLGGLILNLMPCVFPVVSLKVLHFAKLGEEGRHRAWHHGAMFAAGIIATFLLLAGVLLAVRDAGASLGWGFQLQSPVFVTVMIFLLAGLALNLLGVFEIGTSLTRLGGGDGGSGLRASFGLGVLTTVVATPCTAPFMGVAIGFGMTAPAIQSLLIFTMLGVGLALPYLILSASPGLVARLPRAGAWMVTFKQAMAFPLLATAAWLIWVLALQTGVDSVLRILVALTLFAAALWVLGRWPAVRVAPPARLVSRLTVLVLVAGAVLLARPQSLDAAPDPTAITWEPWSPERVAELRAEGRPIFVDFTAAWCLSCKVNERVALRTKAVATRIREHGIVPLLADWTLRDPVIARALASFGRNGVPLYLVYPADASREPLVLPALLTPAVVLDALDQSVSGAALSTH